MIIIQITNQENYDRRSGMDRRQFSYVIYLPDNTDGKERRVHPLKIED